MTMPMKCWAVSSGSYSDYSVHCIFATKEDAEAYVADSSSEHVEEFEFFPAGIRDKFLTVYSAYQYGTWIGVPGSPRPDPRVESDVEIDEDGALTRKYARPEVKVETPYGGGMPTISAKCVDAAAVAKAVKDRRAALDAAGYQTCPSCKGTGQTEEMAGLSCRECGGSGWVPNAPPK